MEVRAIDYMLEDTRVVRDIILAQSGDRNIREQLIDDHLPLVRRVVRYMAHKVFVEQLDEYSIALSALNEAIDRYNSFSQVPFTSYARIVIKHRLTDWYRKQNKDEPVISLSQTIADTSMTVADQLVDNKQIDTQTKLEVEESLICLQAQIEQMGFSMDDLVDRFPLHRDTRLTCIQLARCLAEDNALYEKLLFTGRLPGKALSKACNVPVKTIERNRPAIILLTLLLRSDLQAMHLYIRQYEREDQT